METGKELQRIVLALCIQSEQWKLPWALTDWNTVDVYNAWTYTSRRNLLLDLFFPFFLPASETWVLPLARGLNSCSGECSGVWFRKSSFLSLAPLPNVLQPCPIKIYSSHMFLVVTLYSAAVGLLCTPRLLPQHSKPGNCCAWEDQPAEPCWTVHRALKAQLVKIKHWASSFLLQH